MGDAPSSEPPRLRLPAAPSPRRCCHWPNCPSRRCPRPRGSPASAASRQQLRRSSSGAAQSDRMPGVRALVARPVRTEAAVARLPAAGAGQVATVLAQQKARSPRWSCLRVAPSQHPPPPRRGSEPASGWQASERGAAEGAAEHRSGRRGKTVAQPGLQLSPGRREVTPKELLRRRRLLLLLLLLQLTAPTPPPKPLWPGIIFRPGPRNRAPAKGATLVSCRAASGILRPTIWGRVSAAGGGNGSSPAQAWPGKSPECWGRGGHRRTNSQTHPLLPRIQAGQRAGTRLGSRTRKSQTGQAPTWRFREP